MTSIDHANPPVYPHSVTPNILVMLQLEPTPGKLLDCTTRIDGKQPGDRAGRTAWHMYRLTESGTAWQKVNCCLAASVLLPGRKCTARQMTRLTESGTARQKMTCCLEPRCS